MDGYAKRLLVIFHSTYRVVTTVEYLNERLHINTAQWMNQTIDFEFVPPEKASSDSMSIYSIFAPEAGYQVMIDYVNYEEEIVDESELSRSAE